MNDAYTQGMLVPPLSTKVIREIAGNVRRFFEIDGREYIPIVEICEYLQSMLEGFELEIVEDGKMKEEGLTQGRKIQIPESVYNGAALGEGRARFTMAHELGHALLHENIPPAFARSRVPLKAYEDSEWQANCFAAELLMPFDLVKLIDNPSILAVKCGVSLGAAKVRWEKVQKECGRKIKTDS